MLAERDLFYWQRKGRAAVETIRLFCRGEPRGDVTLGPGDGRREVRASMADPGDGLYRAFLIGERGELPLGVMEPAGGQLSLCRRIFARDIAALGCLQRGEAKLSFRFNEAVWQETGAPGHFLEAPELRRRLERVKHAWKRREGELLLLAIPLEKGEPFPLELLFCLARVMTVEGRLCAVYAFDQKGRPVSP